MGRPKAIYWDEVTKLADGGVQCKHCKHKFKGGASRIKAHLFRIEKQGVAICPNPPNPFHKSEGVDENNDRTSTQQLQGGVHADTLNSSQDKGERIVRLQALENAGFPVHDYPMDVNNTSAHITKAGHGYEGVGNEIHDQIIIDSEGIPFSAFYKSEDGARGTHKQLGNEGNSDEFAAAMDSFAGVLPSQELQDENSCHNVPPQHPVGAEHGVTPTDEDCYTSGPRSPHPTLTFEMQQSKVRTEAANAAKSQFLATISREIRTPTHGILGMLCMLLDTELSSIQRDYAQTAQACGKALVALINELLDRAKIDAGKLELEAVPFDIRSILDDVLSLFSEKSRHKGLELAVFVSDKVPDIVMGDPRRFRQIITNLVENSVKFTERGHIFVNVHLAENRNVTMNGKSETSLNGGSDEVLNLLGGYQLKTLSGCEAADERNSWDNFKHLIADEQFCFDASSNKDSTSGCADQVTLMVCVEDTGIGIPFSAQDRIFMPFVQADSSTTRNYGGTGIGLSISKCLVELMGGQINFVSKTQVGSTFSFTAVFETFKKNSIGDLKKLNSEDLPSGFRGLKAIVIDGKPVRAAVTRYHLKRLEILVKVANSINKAVDFCVKNDSLTSGVFQPDIILVEKDSWISGEDGCFSVWQPDLKENGNMFKLPNMLLLATNISNAEFDKAKAAGFADTVIMKPLRASMVAACLQQVLVMGKKKQQGKDMPNGSTFLRSLLCGTKILVVDDNVVNRRVAEGALKKFGADVKCAESGKAALELLQLPHKFDACFMDILMPEMDGFEATRRIRMMESQANEQMNGGSVEGNAKKSEWHLPILAMTADVIHATYDECLKSGMDGYVSKPFEEENLYQAVAKFFQSKPISDS